MRLLDRMLMLLKGIPVSAWMVASLILNACEGLPVLRAAFGDFVQPCEVGLLGHGVGGQAATWRRKGGWSRRTGPCRAGFRAMPGVERAPPGRGYPLGPSGPLRLVDEEL